MIVAEIQIQTSHSFTLQPIVGTHNMRFDDLDAARAEYERLFALMKRREERANDLPKVIEIIGACEKVTFPLDDLRSVGLIDYAHSNRQRSGLKEAFPNIFG
jgi:hypothetical protein